MKNNYETILSKVNLVHIYSSYFFNTCFNIILTSVPTSHNWSLPVRFSNQNFKCISSVSIKNFAPFLWKGISKVIKSHAHTCSYLRGVWTELALQSISLVSLNFMFGVEFGGFLCNPSCKAPDITVATIVNSCHVWSFRIHCYVLDGCLSLRYLEN